MRSIFSSTSKLIGILSILIVAVQSASILATEPEEFVTLRVMDAITGQPIEGVLLVSLSGRNTPPTALTDARGHARLPLPPDAEFPSVEVRLEKDGFQPLRVRWDCSDPALGRSRADVKGEYEIRMSPGSTSTGQVVDNDGQPVVGATVRFATSDDGVLSGDWPSVTTWQHATPKVTDDRGRWSITSAPADLEHSTLVVEHPEFSKSVQRGDLRRVVLQRRVELTGRILDSKGNPVAGAAVHCNSAYWDEETPVVKTGADGRFAIKLPQRGVWVPVVAQAEGFSPVLRWVLVEPGVEVELVLPDPVSIVGRVVDDDGQPVSGASVRLDGWELTRALQLTTTTQEDGTFRFDNAPVGRVALDAAAPGYLDAPPQEMRPGQDPVNVLKLRAIPVIKGEVVDAATGKPLEHARLIFGVMDDLSLPRFDIERPMELTGGSFEVEFPNRPGYEGRALLRVEAEGYRPFITKPLSGKGPHELGIALEQAPEVTGRLQNPDGTPAVDATVALLCVGQQAWVSGDLKVDGIPVRQTDAEGRFSFPAQATPFWILAVSPAGWAYVAASFDAADLQTIELRPYAALEGEWPTDVEGGSLYANMIITSNKIGAEPVLIWHDTATVEQRRFRFSRLPDTQWRQHLVQLGETYRRQGGLGRTLAPSLWPGKTTSLRPSAAGVRGRIVGLETASFATILIHRVPDISADQAPLTVHEAYAFQGSGAHMRLVGDHRFELHGLEPGEHEYLITALIGGQRQSMGGRWNLDEGLTDLGLIVFDSQPHGQVGAPAPAMLGRGFDDRPIKVEDYQGRFIVGAIWDSCSGLANPHLPTLEALAEQFVADPRVVLISLNTDRVSCGTMGTPLRPGVLEHPGWVPGYVSISDGMAQVRFGADMRWPVNLFIIGPDGRFAATGVSPDQASEVLTRVLKTRETNDPQ